MVQSSKAQLTEVMKRMDTMEEQDVSVTFSTAIFSCQAVMNLNCLYFKGKTMDEAKFRYDPSVQTRMLASQLNVSILFKIIN